MSKPSKNSKSLAIVVTGITTTILTGIFLGQLQASTGFSLYLFSFFFIIPVGAIFTGVVATSGYFIGAYFFQAKTGKNLGFWILLSATLVYLIANYMVYNSHQEDGVFVRDIISFWHYLHLSITHTQMKFGRSVNPVTLGLLGYLYAFLYFVGFACGSFFSSLILSSNPYCEKCSIYLSKTKVRARYTDDLETLSEQLVAFGVKIKNGETMEAIKFHAEEMGHPQENNGSLRTRVTLHQCRSCGIGHLQFDLAHRGENGWQSSHAYDLNCWIEKDRQRQPVAPS